MQSDLWRKVEQYIKAHRQRRYTYLVLTLLSVIIAGSVYALLCMPAISMTKDQPRMEAETVRAVYGDELAVRIRAEAVKGADPTVFVLHTESNGAGLSDMYNFEDMEEDDAVCLVDTEDGGFIELHREFKGNGVVNYWFSLEPEEAVSFLLYCNSDMYTNLDEQEKEKAEERKARKEAGEPSKEAAGGNAAAGHGGTGAGGAGTGGSGADGSGTGGAGAGGAEDGSSADGISKPEESRNPEKDNQANHEADENKGESGNEGSVPGNGKTEENNGSGIGNGGSGSEDNGVNPGNDGSGNDENGSSSGSGNSGNDGNENSSGSSGSDSVSGGNDSGSGNSSSGSGEDGSGSGSSSSGSGEDDSGSGSSGSDSGGGESGDTSDNSGSAVAKSEPKAEISGHFTVHLFLPAYALDENTESTWRGAVTDNEPKQKNSASEAGEITSETKEEAADTGEKTADAGKETAGTSEEATDTGKDAANTEKETTDAGKETTDTGEGTTDTGEETTDTGSGTTADVEESVSSGEPPAAADKEAGKNSQEDKNPVNGSNPAESQTAAPEKLDKATPSDASLATPSNVSAASPSEAEEEGQYFRLYGGTGKNYKAGLRASKRKNNSLELIWRETIKELTLEAVTEGGVTVTMTGPEDLFPKGDLRLVVKEVSKVQGGTATPSDAETLAEDELDEPESPWSEWLFDICIMDGEKEIEPDGPVMVTFEGILDDADNATASVYHIDEENDTADDMEAWTDEDGKVVMRTNHFSLYKVKVAASPEQMTLEELLDGFGITNQFAVYANEMEARGHMEGSIAVKNLKLVDGNFDFGNTDKVGTTVPGNQGTLTLTVTKEVSEGGPETDTYNFVVYDENDSEAERLQMVGPGSAEVTLEPGYYRVFELDASGNPIAQGMGDGFTVSYDAQNLNGFLGGGTADYVNNASYIENFIPSEYPAMKVQNVSALYVGGDNEINDAQKSITTPDGYRVEAQNAREGAIRKPTNMDWEQNFDRLAAFSEALAACRTNDYDKDDLETPGVRFLNMDVPADGVITKGSIADAIGESDKNLNHGIPLGAEPQGEQYLVINLNCANVVSDMVTLPDVGPNSNNAGGWKDEYGRLIWNMVDEGSCYTGYIRMQNAAVGVILAPGGTVDQSATFGGSILADKVIRSANEIHQHSFRLNSFAATTITNTYTGYTGMSLEIRKTNTGETVLPGAVFELYRADENWEKLEETPFASQETDNSGILLFGNLQAGNYLLYETQAPSGYVTPEKPWKITVNAEGIEFPESPEDVRQTEVQADAATVTDTENPSDTGLSGVENRAVYSYTIMNQRRTGNVNVRVEKKWEGDSGGHPGSVTVHLLAGGKRTGDSMELNSSNSWSGEWTGLPPTEEDGTPILYSVEEGAVSGYYPSIAGEMSSDDGEWVKVRQFTDGGTYMLVNSGNALASAGSDTSSLTSISVTENIEAGTQAAPESVWTAKSSAAPGSSKGFELLNTANTERKLGLYTEYINGYYYYRLYAGQKSTYSGNFYYSYTNNAGKLYTEYGNHKYYLSGIPANGGAETTTYSNYAKTLDLYEWQSSSDTTWTFTITNTKEAEIPNKQTLEIQKTIDALRPETGEKNPDTGLDKKDMDMTDFYRLYLDLKAGIIGAPADVVMVLDNSNSMQTTDMGGGSTRADAVVDTAENFAEQLLNSDERNRISIVGYSGTWNNYQKEDGSDSGYSKGDRDAWSSSRWNQDYRTLEENDLEPLREDLLKEEGLSNSSGSGTNIMQALKIAGDLLRESEDTRPEANRYMIFISDGYPTYYYLTEDTAGVSKSQRYPGYHYYQPSNSSAGFYFRGSDYNCQSTFESGFWGRFGTGTSTSGTYAKQPTIHYANQFHTAHDDTIVYALGVGTKQDKDSPLMTDTLKKIATSEENYYFATDADALNDAFYSIMYGLPVTGVSIEDELSQYVEWYGEQPDVLVTMKDKKGRFTKLWQGSGSETGGTVGKAQEGNTAEDGSPIIRDVTFTPAPGSRDTTTGTVKVIFNPGYVLKPEVTYTLSFNVKTTRTAYDKYSENRNNQMDGYGGVKGDAKTDYGTNDTSSGYPGFRSNHNAIAGYIIDQLHYTQDYDHPVVQVAACSLRLRKTDVLSQDKVLQGAGFDLYKEAQQGQEGAVAIPGASGEGGQENSPVYGIKINQDMLYTDEKGEIYIASLVPDTYYLVETKAPAGYQLLEKPVRFILKQAGVDVTGEGTDLGMVRVLPPESGGQPPILVIKNTNGFELPHTGGAGTGFCAAAGFLLMAASAVCYVKRRSWGRGSR